VDGIIWAIRPTFATFSFSFIYMDFLEVSNIRRLEGSNLILPGMSFNQKERERLAIVGESGSGKSTLLKIIAGYIQPDGGKVQFKGSRVLGPDEQLIMGHPGIAYLSQHFELRNNYRMEELLSYANQLSDEEAALLFSVCRIDGLMLRKSNQLSGGEKQRVALAKLLISSPSLLLLDEPFSNLDLIHKQILKTVIQDIGDKLNLTILMVSHDPLDTLPWADRILVVKDGQFIQDGSPLEIYYRPVDEYTGALFGRYNLVDQELATRLGSDVFLRPESLTISSAGDHGVAGVVEKASFLGNIYEVEVVIGSAKLIIQTSKPYAFGDQVFVSLTDPTPAI
jgi:ABC-type Fe3+/spermidine/putrescine transport system ATPase subunit